MFLQWRMLHTGQSTGGLVVWEGFKKGAFILKMKTFSVLQCPISSASYIASENHMG
jgi:hypothetical protein